MNKEIISTSKAPQAIGPYSQAVKVGRFVHTAGQIAIQSTADATIEALLAVDPATIADTTNKPDELPMGLIAFKLAA